MISLYLSFQVTNPYAHLVKCVLMRTLVPFFSLLMVLRLGGQSVSPYHTDPQAARLVTTDIDNFWTAYDLAYPWFDAMIFDSLYLQPATSALRTFIPFRIDNADSLAATIRRHWDYYESVRGSTLSIREQAPLFRASYYALKYLYPEAVFPDIYFVVGRLNAVATTTADGIVISAERYGPSPARPTRARRLQPPFAAAKSLHLVVARELIYVQQQYPLVLDLLGHCVKEGVADLLCELITGEHPWPELAAAGSAREADLWECFAPLRHQKSIQNWLYGQRPENALGRWLGYRIARSFYEEAADKRQAIRDMLKIEDFEGFLKASGYAPITAPGLVDRL